MNERDDVLEQNLARLFERAWRPVRPAPEFRSRLAERLARGERAERFAPTRRLAPRLLAAAAVVLVLAAGYLAFLATTTRSATPEEIVARGCVAVQFSPEDGWREIDAASAKRGLDLAAEAALSIRTPAAVSFQVREASLAAVTLAPDSNGFVELGPRVHTLSLAEGGARVDNLAGRDTWQLTGARARIHLARGSLSLRVAACEAPRTGACLFIVLESGEALSFGTDGRGRALQIGVETVLRDGEIVSASVGASETVASARRPSATVADAPPADATEPQAQKSALAAISGKIQRAESDAPIGPYTVTLLRRQRLPSVSTPEPHRFDGAETFTIHELRTGTYDVYVERAGHAVWRALGVELEAGATHELTVASTPTTSLVGRVVAAATGAPIENALVIVEDDIPAQVIPFDADASAWSAAARTDSNGEFRIAHVSAGAHVLRASAIGFAATWSSRAELASSARLELRLPEPGTLAGRVAHDDGRAWNEAIVIASYMRQDGGFDRFSYAMALTDADGRYSIRDLPAGDYVLLNVLDAGQSRGSPGSRQVHVDAGATTIANLPDTLDGTRFAGRVLDVHGAPLGHLDVTLQPHGTTDDSNWRSQRADAEGRFAFAGVPSAVYDVFVGESLGERFVWAEELSIPRGGDLEHDIRLGAGTIKGRAVSKDVVIAGAFVLLQRAERDGFVFAGRVRTDAQGVFTFERLQPDTYRALVFPEQKGYAPAESNDLWVAINGPLVECELTVERGASLTIVVRDPSGTPLPGTALTFVDADGHAQQFRAEDVTGADGRYAIEGVAAGRWTVTAATRTGATITQSIELNVGDERELVLTIP